MSAARSIVDRHPVIEEVLETWHAALGAERAAYAGHAYRVYNTTRSLLGARGHDDLLAVASVFHDLGIWSDGTFDYLAPSIARAEEYVRARRPDLAQASITGMIANHHLLQRVRGLSDAELAEAFRRADLVDVTRGLYRAGLDGGWWRELVATFPYAGFHGVLLKAGLRWCVRHPLRPLPMLRLTPSRNEEPR